MLLDFVLLYSEVPAFQIDFQRFPAPDVASDTPVELWWQDELRLGQKNGLVRRWARTGSRPRQLRDQRYKSVYIFGAVCPARGTGAALVMPFANTDAMQAHLQVRTAAQ